MQRKDVESLICATDAGREGELIFRLVYHQCGCKKPVERLWISSMEDSAIREGFQKLRPGTEYDALYEAALCRERADWIVGINATRLFSCLYGQTLNVGRVMTPTLAMVVMRDAAIRAFKPEPFYSAELKFRDFQAGGERMKAKADAEKLVAECCQAGSAIITKVEQKEKSEKPPALFDLTSLQREANRQLGFTAQQTLDYTQALYEKKLVTYPRTDSRYLTDDMAPLVPELVSVIQQSFQIQADVPAPVNAAQVINSKKVTDHHQLPCKCAGFSEDSSYYLLCSLENVDENGRLESKADMFTKRTIRPERAVTSVDTPAEALAISIGERGRVDLPYMSELLGTPGEYEKSSRNCMVSFSKTR